CLLKTRIHKLPLCSTSSQPDCSSIGYLILSSAAKPRTKAGDDCTRNSLLLPSIVVARICSTMASPCGLYPEISGSCTVLAIGSVTSSVIGAPASRELGFGSGIVPRGVLCWNCSKSLPVATKPGGARYCCC